ncbi:hypothetical protein ACF3N0_00075 [Moraxella atlantae]|uniref:hypothetical protein n=1 Tax=Faucicola atlantae TaxID=34059 RepID=UPI00375288DD
MGYILQDEIKPYNSYTVPTLQMSMPTAITNFTNSPITDYGVITTPPSPSVIDLSTLPVSNLPKTAVIDVPTVNTNTNTSPSVGGFLNGLVNGFKTRLPSTWDGMNQDYAKGKEFVGHMGKAFGDMDGKDKFATIGGAINGLAGMYYGHKQLQNAERVYNLQKDTFNKNWQAQAKMTNSQLQDRQARRARLSDKNMSVSDYMRKFGV